VREGALNIKASLVLRIVAVSIIDLIVIGLHF